MFKCLNSNPHLWLPRCLSLIKLLTPLSFSFLSRRIEQEPTSQGYSDGSIRESMQSSKRVWALNVSSGCKMGEYNICNKAIQYKLCLFPPWFSQMHSPEPVAERALS